MRNPNRMGEIIDKLKGKANQIKGDITGNDADRLKGVAQEQKGRIKGAFEDVKSAAKEALRNERGEDI